MNHAYFDRFLWPLWSFFFHEINAKNINLSYFIVNILKLEREKNNCMDCFGWKIGFNKIGHKTVIVVIDAPKQIILASIIKVYHLVIFFKILSINVGFSHTDLLNHAYFDRFLWPLRSFFFTRSTPKDVIHNNNSVCSVVIAWCDCPKIKILHYFKNKIKVSP